jgi:hypothetical protein
METERHLIVVLDFSISTAFLKQNLNTAKRTLIKKRSKLIKIFEFFIGKKYMGFAQNGE